jgi:1,4-dihydroxy-2-naphthoate octaprenyltransferase
MSQNKSITLLKTMRPPFLILTPVCVFLGLAISPVSDSTSWLSFVLIITGALSAHISVNTLNEYFDYKSGLDLKTVKTPFSGGSGALPEHPEAAQLVLIAGLVSLAITATIGLYFLFTGNLQILPIGLIGVVLVITYTQWLNRLPLLCLIAPGLGFGILMVLGTSVVLGGSLSMQLCLLSLIPFFLTNNILLLNQYPDLQADQETGRRTFPIAFGLQISTLVYAAFALAAYVLIGFSIVAGQVPMLGMIALLPAALSFFAFLGASKHSSRIGEHPQHLAANVAAGILTPLLLGTSMMIN